MKITLAVLLLISVLAVGLSVPGIHYVGSGVRKPQAIKQKKGDIADEKKNRANDEVNRELQRELGQVKGKEDEKKDPNKGKKQPRTSVVQKIFAFFTAIGKLLLIPVIVAFIGFLLYILVQLLPLLKGVSGIANRFHQWLAQLRDRLKSKKSTTEDTATSLAHPDPVEAMKRINTLEPRDTILTAYRCMLGFLERWGQPFLPRLTPYELLATMPPSLEALTEPAGVITDHYINTAFGTGNPSVAESKEVIDALFAVQLLLEKNRSTGRES